MRGFAASLADTIEAYRLALTLTAMRGKHAPGLDELRDASVATLCRGERAHVDSFLWPSVVGHEVGKVGARIGRNVRIGEDVRAADFSSRTVRSGGSVMHREERPQERRRAAAGA